MVELLASTNPIFLSMIDLALAAQVLFWLVMLGVFLASDQASLFHPATVYLGFHGLVFVLRPILVQAFGFDANWQYMIFQPSDEAFIRTLVVSSVGMFAFLGACLATGWTRVEFVDVRQPQFSSSDRSTLVVTTLLLAPAVAYSIWATRNGIEGERVGGIYILTNSTGYLNEAQHFAMPLICLWLVATRLHWANLFPILAYVGYRIWFGWSRWTILLFLLMVLLSYCWYHRRKWLPWWSVLTLVPGLVVFNLLGHNRDLLKQLIAGDPIYVIDARPGTTQAEKIRKQLDTQDFSNFDYLAYVVSVVPERTGAFTYGLQYLQLFTEPIPRILWHAKPVGAPIKTINIGAYGNFIGLTVSLCGDGWMSGGWLGLVITLGLAGALAGRAHRWFFQNKEHNLGALGYIAILSLLPQWYRDGGISIFKFLLFTLIPVLTWMLVSWLLGARRVPAYSTSLAPGAGIRFVELPDPGSRATAVSKEA